MKCSNILCKNEGSKLKCPICVKMNKTVPYCSQDCFKKDWKNHKINHENLDTNPWPEFQYTGEMRPYYPLSERRIVPEHIMRPDYAEDGIPKSELNIREKTQIRILNKDEQEKMRKVCKLAREVLDIAGNCVKVGITTDEIDVIVHNACIERNVYPSPLNYMKFPKSCCTSVNEVICHGIPDRRPLENGDMINIDITVYYDGMHGDLNETYIVGEIDESGKKLIDSAKECLMEAIKVCKPGFRYRDLGEVIQRIANKNGHSIVKSYGGHGINYLFHCAPAIPHYSNNKCVGIMKPGHTFTIEPMLNEGDWRDEHWLDNWSVVTIDGKRSAQFEHTLLITEDGVEILTI